MKQLADFEGEKGIEVAAEILEVVIRMLANEKNKELKNETSPAKMYAGFMKNSPAEMNEIFAILSEEDPAEYKCNGTVALANMLVLANDPILFSLFVSGGQMGDATSSGSASGNSEG